MSTPEKLIGKPLDRVDGRLKVTGEARYAAEHQIANLAYGVLVTSRIAQGRITHLDTSVAEKAPGVVAVLTYRNAPRTPVWKEVPGTPNPEVGQPLQPLRDDRIYHNGQPIAVVVAETFEQATHAAGLVQVTYREEPAVTDLAAALAHAFPPGKSKKSENGAKKPEDYQRGDPDTALANAAVRLEETYTAAADTHNPMEPLATIAVWEGSKLTLYDKTQGVDVVRKQAMQALGMRAEDIRVISPFVGGAFGCGLRAWSNTFLTALAAKLVRRPVKLVLTRAQMFTIPGYRPYTVQKVALGASRDGKLTALHHEATGQTSVYEQYTESVLEPAELLYACPNVGTRYRLAAMNVNSPTPMRAPGESTGLYALECALDELAYALRIDPIELRLRNHADRDPRSGLPWSSKHLKECYQEGAQRIGWGRRNPEPGSMREGRLLVGYGMASATWPTHRRPATVRVRIHDDGTAIVQSATADIGPGTYTSMTQVAAQALGLPPERVRFELGDTRYPPAPVEGGSMTMASVGSAVYDVALKARKQVLRLAAADTQSPLHKATADQVDAADGRLFWKDRPSRGETYMAILKRHGKDVLDITGQSKAGDESKKYSMRAFGAHFAQVHVDPDLKMIRVARVVTGFAAGRIVNPKTAHSQAIGGIVGGIGMALLEQTIWDGRNARVVNANLADYHVPVNADIPELDVFFVEEEDPHVNPLGVKGLAELALAGLAPAVANAVYHATGKRVRELPITMDKLF